MAYKVNFYNFGKKVNSTGQPVGTGTEYDCIVRTETGILNPIVSINYGLASAPLFNYCKIPAFNRYYWVREWSFSDRLWTAELEVDPLASFKSYIGGSSLYVLRAAGESTPYIVDTHYPLQDLQAVDVTQAGAIWFSSVNTVDSGCFIVGLRGRINSDQTAGGVTYLAMTPAQFKTFTEDLFNDQLNNYIVGGQGLDIGTSLALMIFNPTQYIASCIWLPGTPTSETPATGFNVGWWGFTTGAKIVSSMTPIIYTCSLSLANHPQRTANSKYLNGAPFTKRVVNLPRFGLLDLTNKLPANADTLDIDLTVDPISGQGLYRIYYELENSNTYIQVDEIQCQIGVEMPLSSNQVTIQEAVASISSAAQSILDVAQFNGVGAAADIASAFQILQPHINDISQASGFLGYNNSIGTPYIVSTFNYQANRDDTEEGFPLCKIKTISALSGYMKVLHGDVTATGATASELEQIRGYLEEGFYYE